jgi:acyl-CoA synthetase (AMP-forming)/AMP-acid ligase II/acyl carrier protein
MPQKSTDRSGTAETVFPNWVELARRHAELYRDKLAFCSLDESGTVAERVTYGQFDRRVRAAATALQNLRLEEAPALLLFESGIDYVVAFFACVYAKVIAIPAYPPQEHRGRWRRLEAVIRDSRASVILSTQDQMRGMSAWLDSSPDMQELQRIEVDRVPDSLVNEWTPVDCDATTLAYLQYTSGSTGHPKGVMVTQGNLFHNQKAMIEAFDIPRESDYVTWLPIFHDMGLVGTILQPFYLGGTCYLMSPFDFVKRPGVWLEAISRYRGAVSWAPNFAYELCTKRVSESAKAHLDLSCWRVAANAAEPVRSDTLERFAAAFAGCGFSRGAMCPSYGLAESTLLVSASQNQAAPVTARLDASAFAEGRVAECLNGEAEVVLAGSGRPIPGQTVRIVDPSSGREVPADRVGEIWVKGLSVAAGYWKREKETAATFGNRSASDGDGPFLRTGDLGFLRSGELFVCGRIKDVIIVRGQNHYPQDLEYTSFTAHAALRLGNAIAFSFEAEGNEHVAVVQELRKGVEVAADEIIDSIRRQVLKEHGLALSMVALIAPDSLPKTSSGKIQRQLCKAELAANRLPVVALWRSSQPDQPHQAAPKSAGPSSHAVTVVRQAIAEALPAAPVNISLDLPLTAYGLDSLSALTMIDALNRELGIDLSFTEVVEVVSLQRLVQAVERELNRTRSISITRVQTAVASDLPHRLEPFPLTEMQQAYWVGRTDSVALGGVSLQIHFEFDIPRFDAERFERAWQAVIDRHEMLRAVLLPSAEQAILAEVPRFRLEVHDLTTERNPGRQAVLAAAREQVARTVLPLDQWPPFELKAYRLPQGVGRVIVHLDGIFIDFRALQIVMRDLARFYRDPAAAGSAAAPALSYRDYVLDRLAYQNSEAYERHLAWWRERAPSLWPRPQLPLRVQPGELSEYRISHLRARLDRTLWEPLKERIRAAGLTQAAFLLAAYAEIIARWSQSPQFSLTVAAFNRKTVHPAVNEVVGNFSTFTLVPVDCSSRSGFLGLALAVQRDLHQALEHSDVSGVRVVRELFQQQAAITGGIMPVVFTNYPAGFDGSPSSLLTDLRNGLGDVVHCATQTPQIWLDCQVWYEDGGIELHWDVADGLFPENMPEDMLRAYEERLRQLAVDDDHAWTKARTVSTAAAQPVLTAALKQRRMSATEDTLPAGLPRDDFEERVARIIGEIAGLREISVRRNLFELGLNSLHVVLMALRLGEEFATNISPTELFGCATIAEIARRLHGENNAASPAPMAHAVAARRNALRSSWRRRQLAVSGEVR